MKLLLLLTFICSSNLLAINDFIADFIPSIPLRQNRVDAVFSAEHYYLLLHKNQDALNFPWPNAFSHARMNPNQAESAIIKRFCAAITTRAHQIYLARASQACPELSDVMTAQAAVENDPAELSYIFTGNKDASVRRSHTRAYRQQLELIKELVIPRASVALPRIGE